MYILYFTKLVGHFNPLSLSPLSLWGRYFLWYQDPPPSDSLPHVEKHPVHTYSVHNYTVYIPIFEYVPQYQYIIIMYLLENFKIPKLRFRSLSTDFLKTFVSVQYFVRSIFSFVDIVKWVCCAIRCSPQLVSSCCFK